MMALPVLKSLNNVRSFRQNATTWRTNRNAMSRSRCTC